MTTKYGSLMSDSLIENTNNLCWSWWSTHLCEAIHQCINADCTEWLNHHNHSCSLIYNCESIMRVLNHSTIKSVCDTSVSTPGRHHTICILDDSLYHQRSCVSRWQHPPDCDDFGRVAFGDEVVGDSHQHGLNHIGRHQYVWRLPKRRRTMSDRGNTA